MAEPPSSMERALSATRESKRIEFKAELDPNASGAWIECVKDIVAIANSGGGVILFGVDNQGGVTGWDPRPVLSEDPAKLVDRLAKFTGEQFDDLDVVEATRGGAAIAAMVIGSRTGSPLVFEKPGLYKDPSGNEKCAFAQGTVYFRHGAKSAPSNARDIVRFARDEEARVRREILKGVRKVTTAPKGSEVVVVRKGSAATKVAERVRIVNDPDAPAAVRADFDVTHPYRRTELVRRVNEILGRPAVSGHDIHCIRKVHNVDLSDAWFHSPRFSSPQYSEDFAVWVADQIGRDRDFVLKTRDAVRAE